MNMQNSGIRMRRFRRKRGFRALVLFGLSRFEWDDITVKITADQAKLARIALNTKDTDVRHAAVKKLTNQAANQKLCRGIGEIEGVT